MDSHTHSKDDATKPLPDTDIDEKHVESALSGELVSAGSQQLQRKLGGKEIQLFAVGGAIGTCMP
jgi:amino acid transporter